MPNSYLPPGGTSWWQWNKSQLPVRPDPVYVYPTSGEIFKSGATTQISGTTLVKDKDLHFPARGGKSFYINSSNWFSATETGATLTLAISGSNNDIGFSGSLWSVNGNVLMTGTTVTVIMPNFPMAAYRIEGVYTHGTLPEGIDRGHCGLYWKYSGVTSSSLTLMSGARLDWNVIN